MRKNKFYLVITPLLLLVVLPLSLVLNGLRQLPTEIRGLRSYPSRLRKSWQNATWF